MIQLKSIPHHSERRVSPDLEAKLAKDFPDMFRDFDKPPEESCMHWGCEHSDGWHSIIRALCMIISRHLGRTKQPADFKFLQVKEKFGALRIHAQGVDDFISGAIRMSEEMSVRTCEVTGHPGEMCRKGGWYRTLSRTQAEKDGYVVCSDEKKEG